jgi:hypothetical protein
LRGHCGADSHAIRAKFNTDEIARNFKKAAKSAEAKDQILLNLEHILRRPAPFVRPPRAHFARKTAPALRNL